MRGAVPARNALPAVAAVCALALSAGGCGGSDHRSDDTRALRKLANGARADLLAGRAAAFCARLTPAGRARSLGFRVDFDHRPPRTCEEVVRRERAVSTARPDVDVAWPGQLRAARVRVGKVRSGVAHLDLVLPGHSDSLAGFTARKTSAGWRLDDSNAIPVGH